MKPKQNDALNTTFSGRFMRVNVRVDRALRMTAYVYFTCSRYMQMMEDLNNVPPDIKMTMNKKMIM